MFAQLLATVLILSSVPALGLKQVATLQKDNGTVGEMTYDKDICPAPSQSGPSEGDVWTAGKTYKTHRTCTDGDTVYVCYLTKVKVEDSYYVIDDTVVLDTPDDEGSSLWAIPSDYPSGSYVILFYTKNCSYGYNGKELYGMSPTFEITNSSSLSTSIPAAATPTSTTDLPSSTSATSTPSESANHSSSPSKAAIIGGTVGGVLGGALIVLLVGVLYFRSRRRRTKNGDHSTADKPELEAVPAYRAELPPGDKHDHYQELAADTRPHELEAERDVVYELPASGDSGPISSR